MERERLERDLRYFKQELENERDQFRRNLLMQQIRDVERQIVNILTQERAEAQRKYLNLLDALNSAMQKKKK
jgi:hypothetical protein